MQRSARIVFLALVFVAAIFSSGCIDKTFYPATEIEVVKIDPYGLIPTATDTASLPTTQISIRSLSKIPCTLKAASFAFFTSLGDEITYLRVSRQPMETKLDAEGTLDLVMSPYSRALVDIFELSNSDISPVMAKITLHFNDINGNWVDREAHCLLYKYEAKASTASRRAP